MSRKVTGLVVWLSMVVAIATPTAHALTKDASNCQAALAKGLASFKKAKLKAWQKCLDAVLKGKPCDTAKRDAAIAKGIAKATATITTKCTDALLFTAQPNGVGFANNCELESGTLEPYEQGCFNLPVGNASQLAACLICWKEGELYEWLKILNPCLQGIVPNGSDLDCGTPPGSCPAVNDKATLACLGAIAKNGRKYLLAVEKELEKCKNNVRSGKIPGPCPDAVATEKINRAIAKLGLGISKKCTALPPWWDVCPEDSVAPCDQTIATVGDVTSCVQNAANEIVNELICWQYPGPTEGIICPSEGTTTTTTTTPTTTLGGGTTTTTLCPTCCPNPSAVIGFTTGTPLIGGGGCGIVEDSSSNVLVSLDCGGHYMGGGGTAQPLPITVPDNGKSYIRPTGCAGSAYSIAPTVPGDHAGLVTVRNCTSAGVADPAYPACDSGTRVGFPCRVNSDCPPSGTCGGGGASMTGCLSGPPLPVANSTTPSVSICLVNRVSTSASGSGSCAAGSLGLDMALASDIYLEGDLLDGSAGDRPNIAGVQPCPLCTGPSGSETCKGGPNHALPCTPAGSALSAALPTSHDCPPPAGSSGANYLGAMTISPFSLTSDPTGTSAASHKVANLIGSQEVFCGYCSSSVSPIFRNPAVACTSNANCVGLTGCPGASACPTCRQRSSGAFGTASANPGAEHEITLVGAPAGACIGDGLAHSATLVGAFCIPPLFNATFESVYDVPGPGAMALVGQVQLVP